MEQDVDYTRRLQGPLGVSDEPTTQQPAESVQSQQGAQQPAESVQSQQGAQQSAVAGENTDVASGAVADFGSASETSSQGAINLNGTPSLESEKDKPGKPRMSYEELYRAMTPYKPPTSEELERERRKEKRKAVFAALGDGITALSNLYFTTQYAPSMNVGETMSGRTRARFDQLKKEREAKSREYMEGFMRAMRLDAEDAQNERNWRHTLERDKVNDAYRAAADARAEAKAERDAAYAELRLDEMQGKIDEQEAAARRAQIRADYEEALLQSQISRNNRANRGTGGGGKRYEAKWYDEYGDEQTAYGTSQSAADREAERRSREAGTWETDYVTSEIETERYDRRGRSNGTSTSTTTRAKGGHSVKPANPKPKPAKQPAKQPAQQPAKQPAKQPAQSGGKRWSNASKIQYN